MKWNDNQILPWHQKQWDLLQFNIHQSRFPHAILLTGIEGIGKDHFAKLLGKSLLCLHPTEKGLPCESCQSCLWVKAGSHPDYVLISPEEEGKAIKVDQVRELRDKLILSAHHASGYKIAIINPADAMNNNAANAFLKTLEEPSKDTLIILVTHRPSALPATIRSRCHTLNFPVPEKSVALEWLKKVSKDKEAFDVLLPLAQGAPLKVLKLLEEDELSLRETLFQEWQDQINGKITIVALSERWKQYDTSRLLFHWISWVIDMVKLSSVPACQPSELVNQDFRVVLHAIAQKIGVTRLCKFYEKLLEAKQGAESQLHWNEQLLIEDVLLSWPA